MRPIVRLSMLAVVVSALAACSTSSGPSGQGKVGPGGGDGPGSAEDLVVEAGVAEDLTFLREEEKLARDVYLTLHEEWGLDVFENIAGAEQRHMDAVLVRLEQLGAADPVKDDTVGVFENQELAGLYVELTEQGRESEVEALKVGATIEDLDIRDIEVMENRTDNAAVLETYGRLKCGSGNHMRAFYSRLSDEGLAYEPQFISADNLAVILASPQERCGGGRGGGH